MVLMAIATTILAASPPSYAKDCPTVLDTVKQITIKNDPKTAQINLRKTPDTASENVIDKASNGQKLEIISREPKDDNQYCWYNVKSAKGASVWVAGDYVDPQSLQKSNPSAIAQDAQPAKPNPPVNTQLNNNKKSNFLNLLEWVFRIGVVGSIVLGAVAFYVLSQRLEKLSDRLVNLKQFTKELEKNLSTIEFANSQTKINNGEIYTLKKELSTLQEHYTDLESSIQEIQRQPFKELLPSPVSLPVVTIEPIFPPKLPKVVEDLVHRFNSQDINYFRDDRFNPLKLAPETIQGVVGLDAKRVTRLETIADKSQAYYLEVYLDGDHWLIPNASTVYLSQILNNLQENPEIFRFNTGHGKDRPELIRPAKLKSAGSGNWEIAELGEFQR